MATVIERREFTRQIGYRLDDLADIELRRCTFVECQSPAPRGPADRPTLLRVTLTRCEMTASTLAPLIAEDCTVDGIAFHRGIWGPQLIAGCAFRHVVLRGNVTGGVRFAPSSGWLTASPQQLITDDPFTRANLRYYADVDWALDISEAAFTGVEMAWCDVPTALIRRDPETQVVVTRESVGRGDWRAACEGSSLWVAIERFLAGGLPDTVLVAPRRGRSFAQDMRAIERLCAAGIADR